MQVPFVLLATLFFHLGCASQKKKVALPSSPSGSTAAAKLPEDTLQLTDKTVKAKPLRESVRDVQIIVDDNGKVDLFFVGVGGRIYHVAQTRAGGKWLSPRVLSGLTHKIKVARNTDGRLELFHIGLGGNLYHQYQQDAKDPSSWSPEFQLDGIGIDIDVARDKSGSLVLFHVGVTGRIYRQFQLKPGISLRYSNEIRMSGRAMSIAAIADHEGKLHVFHVGVGANVLGPVATKITGLLASTAPLAAIGAASAAAGVGAAAVGLAPLSFTHNTLLGHVADAAFGRNFTNFNSGIYGQSQNEAGELNSFGNQQQLDGRARSLAVGKDGNGMIQLFHVGAGNNLYERQLDDDLDWSDAQEVPVPGEAMWVHVLSSPNGEVDLLHIGRGYQIYYNTRPIGGKATWMDAERDKAGNVHLVYAGLFGRLYYAMLPPGL